MKFYDTAGHCIRETEDTEFGWNLEDSIEEYYKSKSLFWRPTEDDREALIFNPQIPVYGAKTASECIVNEPPSRDSKTNLGVPSNETLSALIDGDSMEEKILLSIICPSKFRCNEQVKATHTDDISSDPNDDKETTLQTQGSSKYTLSLMDELNLAENINMKFSMFDSFTEPDSGIDCGDGFLMVDDELKDSLRNCDYQVLRLRQDIRDLIRKHKIELERTEDLIKETVNLEKDLRETVLLDKILHLLKGNTDKQISTKHCNRGYISVKMAKKGQIQFYTEVATDEEWDKLMEKDGLIVVDVYSEWCGPCSGMQGNLKKIKVEVGGDMLQIALAKSDGISCLERFRNKSEPTWMFISEGKMVNLMYGANAPMLTRLILEELQKEKERVAGIPRTDRREITDLADEEQVRVDAENAKIEAARLIEEGKKAQQLHERRLAQAMHILDTYSHIGVILILPRGRPHYVEVLADLWTPAGLHLHSKEKIKLNAEMLEEILYFSEGFSFPEEVEEELLNEESMALFIKPANEDIGAIMDDVVLELVYGASKHPPGSPKSVAQLLVQKVEEAIKEKEEEEAVRRAERGEEEEPLLPSEEENKEIICIWAPPNNLTKAYAFKNFFHSVAMALIIPEPEPIPPHLAVAYDAFKRRDVLSLMEQYPEAVMRYGFFTSDEPEEAKLIAKNPQNFERKLVESTTHTEKMVVQLSKKRSDAFLAFAQLGPSRISTNVATGEEECKIFFPEDYDIEEETIQVVAKKAPKKKGKKKPTREEGEGAVEGVVAEEEQVEVIPEEGEVVVGEGEEEEGVEGEGAEGAVEEGAEDVEAADEADKATSPMTEEILSEAGSRREEEPVVNAQ